MADGVKAALELKAEGNALYAKQDYLAAYKKYSDATEIDDKNAVLYANRAACSLGLKCFSDVVADAQKVFGLGTRVLHLREHSPHKP
ncbi:uncharacterized protein LAESUDRAFT_184557 [Laetiporus sulphureus 93-53]|uniref:TPR-like protein n=1 Tax=Laetiporus sulphureus 93-53 TaxID=1314785 RepID=A0A165E480_9APHY|nr:uncharacterized protein LAESUDRAFT_184557 [Laetiporus sulphureus 93-53]KZT06215.1 hypothetical protein LAESUDRAFT_184557 [Laetiporus sulphureus 93-53]